MLWPRENEEWTAPCPEKSCAEGLHPVSELQVAIYRGLEQAADRGPEDIFLRLSSNGTGSATGIAVIRGGGYEQCETAWGNLEFCLAQPDHDYMLHFKLQPFHRVLGSTSDVKCGV